jgi:hypothetical protein
MNKVSTDSFGPYDSHNVVEDLSFGGIVAYQIIAWNGLQGIAEIAS